MLVRKLKSRLRHLVDLFLVVSIHFDGLFCLGLRQSSVHQALVFADFVSFLDELRVVVILSVEKVVSFGRMSHLFITLISERLRQALQFGG